MSKLNVMTLKELLETDTTDMCHFSQIKNTSNFQLPMPLAGVQAS